MNNSENPLRIAPLDDEQFFALALRHLDDVAEAGEEAALTGRLRDDPDARRRFVELCRQIGMLHETMFSEAGDEEQWDRENYEFGIMDEESESPEAEIHHSPFTIRHSPFPLSPLPSPLSPFSVGGPVFSYIAATLILGAMLLGAWAYTITHDYDPSLASNSRGSTTPGEPAPHPDPLFVARVTGMKDCRWADPQTETYAGAFVPLGRKYALASGLMEITYRSGAKVILEGPCRYEVESAAGGFIALGKLTARVEKRSEVRGRRSEVRGQRSEAGGLAASAASMQPQAAKPQVPSPKPQDLSPKTQISKSLFAVRTPTALVTDLGTEFGVEVAANGDTTSHVFQGTVVVHSLAAASTRREPSPENSKFQIPNQQILLSAGQSARIDSDRITVLALEAGGERFVRELSKRELSPPEVELIGRLDYSDTWTANTSARPGNYVPLESPEPLRVEQCHGNPPRSWVLSSHVAVTTWPGGARSGEWPGFSSRGSKSGFTERSGLDGICYMGIEYGLRDDFTVQFDAVQTDDRINVTVGDEPATIEGDRSLSVFFRAPGGPYPELGLYNRVIGEADSKLGSGISAPFQWHNYAVRFNLRDRRLTVWIDGKRRGEIDLARFDGGPESKGRSSWANLNWTNQFVTIGGFTEKGGGRVWTDNFRIGTPVGGIAERAGDDKR